jgi:hypothetical protein
LHITMAMSCCIVLVKMAPCSNSSGCLWQTADLTLSCKSAKIWALDGHIQVHFSWRTWHTWLSEHPDGAVIFSPWWHWKVPFSSCCFSW